MTQRLCNAYTFEGQDITSPASSESNSGSRDEYSEAMALILSMSSHQQKDKQADEEDNKSSKETDENIEEDEEDEKTTPCWSEEELAIIKTFYESEREYEQEDKAMLEKYFLEYPRK